MSMEFTHHQGNGSDGQVASFEQQDGSFSKNAQDDLKASQQHMDLLKQKQIVDQFSFQRTNLLTDQSQDEDDEDDGTDMGYLLN